MSRAGLALASLLLVACSSTSPAASPAGSAQPSAAAARCPAIELRLPDGSLLDLSGTWVHSQSRIFYLYQTGRCLWWVGGAPDGTIDPELLGPIGATTMVFRGDIQNDFTIVGEWAFMGDDVPIRTGGTAELRIVSQDDGSVRLVSVRHEGIDYEFLSDAFLRRAE